MPGQSKYHNSVELISAIMSASLCPDLSFAKKNGPSTAHSNPGVERPTVVKLIPHSWRSREFPRGSRSHFNGTGCINVSYHLTRRDVLSTKSHVNYARAYLCTTFYQRTQK